MKSKLTTIEILVVTAVVIIIGAMLIPVFLGTVERSDRAAKQRMNGGSAVCLESCACVCHYE